MCASASGEGPYVCVYLSLYVSVCVCILGVVFILLICAGDDVWLCELRCMGTGVYVGGVCNVVNLSVE